MLLVALAAGLIRAELGFIYYHCVASSTNYTREGINSKISENNRSRKRSLVQLATFVPPCRSSSTSTPASDVYVKNIFKLKIDQIRKKIFYTIFVQLILNIEQLHPLSATIALSVCLSATP